MKRVGQAALLALVVGSVIVATGCMGAGGGGGGKGGDPTEKRDPGDPNERR